MKKLTLLIAILTLAGCSDQPAHESNSTTIHNQVGRFAALQGQGGVPPIMFDTVTGCGVTIEKGEDGKYVMNEIQDSCRRQNQLPFVDTVRRLDK
jgi:hypothetical protein